jgi:hypothetical protein
MWWIDQVSHPHTTLLQGGMPFPKIDLWYAAESWKCSNTVLLFILTYMCSRFLQCPPQYDKWLCKQFLFLVLIKCINCPKMQAQWTVHSNLTKGRGAIINCQSRRKLNARIQRSPPVYNRWFAERLWAKNRTTAKGAGVKFVRATSKLFPQFKMRNTNTFQTETPKGKH